MTDFLSLESAIPDHLLKARTRQNRVSKTFRPSSKSYVARFDQSVETLVIAYLGIQYYPDDEEKAGKGDELLKAFFSHDIGPDYFDRGLSEYQFGCRIIIFTAYWRSKESFETWNTQSPFNLWWGGR